MWCFYFAELTAVYANKKIKISSELYKRGCVNTWEEGLVSAQKIGFPVMIKASEGGGGKGIRKVEGPEDFANLFRQVSKKLYINLVNSQTSLLILSVHNTNNSVLII